MTDDLQRLFKEVQEKQKRDADQIKQISDQIGHNGGPKITDPSEIRAAWFKFADEYDARRLAKLHLRIERKKAGLRDLTRERTAIMMRCIRRMRRAEGKE
jgi:hypothetical protein